ncbi:phosphoglycerate mutase family protein [Fusobacterium sp. 27098_8_59]|jgi:fructose-2,6-bisphosphate 2-phosphatase|uniref:histidine phosphatase family protein n=1 Tax=Fusobacterium sp. 27098_8_59 TaxID=3003691 RepID=UPI00352E1F92
MKLIFVRHGEPLKYEYGISKMGIDELELLGEYLKENFNVSKIFSATSQRATESADVLNKKFNYNIEYYQWLSEFKYRIPLLNEKGVFPWELAPEYWINNDELLHYNDVFNNPLIKNSEIPKRVKEVWQGIDKIISENGYTREGNLYIAQKRNTDEIIIVTHFATMAIIIAHLLNISIVIALNLLFMSPSSYSIFATEEINYGKVIFRCLELGSTKHLYMHNELKSEYGRQDEIKENIE